MKYDYYIHKDTYTTNKQGLKVGVTISKVPSIYKINYTDSDGPFENLPSLRRKSTIFRNLLLRNSKRAQQICLEKNIDTITDFILTEEDVSVTKDFVELIEHCIKGKVTKGNRSGIHFYSSQNVRILRVLEENKVNGIFEAQIEFYDSQTAKWVKKEKPSTFFPLKWSLNDLFHECLFAVNNKTKKTNTENVFVSKTKSGIKVEIIEKGNILISIYPVFENKASV